ncbi:phage baseplate assembly protein V [Pseudomonas boanensis]|uniref:phage baseplate assembly protein V n=1 Tax=Metapseudomonas boanensis TaxID=2822138 RepID=UPI0035D4FBB3
MDDLMERTVERLVERVGSSYYGKYRGIVTDVDDPNNQCRIRATIPAVLGEHACGWALPAAPFAGDGHGMVMLPKVGSGVWIEFEAGQLDNPIWSGAWWASGERPEPQGAGVRVIVSEQGHKVILDDEANEVKIVHGDSSIAKVITLSSNEVVIACGACEIKITNENISLNNGLIKVGLAGVSLVNGAMTFGVPP